MSVRSGAKRLAALGAVALLTAGCSDHSGAGELAEDEPGDSVSVSQSPSPSPTDPAVEAYVAMWEDAAMASHTSDVDHPRLDDHATGEALMLLKFVMEGHAKDGLVARGGPTHDVDTVESSADRRELRDCMDQTDWLMYKENGELEDNVPGSHSLVEATVERRDAEWIVTDLITHGAATC